MKLRGKLAGVTLNRIVGIAACTAAAGPTAYLIAIIDDVMRDPSLTIASEFWEWPLWKLVSVGAVMALFTLPSIILVAAWGYALAKMRFDSFVVSTASGSAVGYIAVNVTMIIARGRAPGFDFSDSSKVGAAALLLLACFIISSLYWLVTVRRDRNKRHLAEEHARALRAME